MSRQHFVQWLDSYLLSNYCNEALTANQADQFHATKGMIGSTFWVFGEEGLLVYNPDGKELKKH